MRSVDFGFRGSRLSDRSVTVGFEEFGHSPKGPKDPIIRYLGLG